MRQLLVPMIVGLVVTCITGCTDAGTGPSPKPVNAPSISALLPDSAAVGDTVRILGTDFGASRGTSSVTIGGQDAKTLIGWSNTEIRAEVPLLAVSDSVRVTVDGHVSNAVRFKARMISYSQTLNPVFQSTCTGCHGGTNNLFVDSYAHLTAGTSINGPVVTPGNGEGSYLIRMLRGVVPGKPRMPQGGPYLPDPLINKFSTWIQQGAQNN